MSRRGPQTAEEATDLLGAIYCAKLESLGRGRRAPRPLRSLHVLQISRRQSPAQNFVTETSPSESKLDVGVFVS